MAEDQTAASTLGAPTQEWGPAVRAGTHRLTLVFQARASAPAQAADTEGSEKRLDPRQQFWAALLEGPADENTIAAHERDLEKDFGPKLTALVLSRLSPQKPSPDVISRMAEFRILARVRRYGSLEVALTVFGLGSIASLVGNNFDTLMALIELYAPEAFSEAFGNNALPVTATLVASPQIPTGVHNPRLAQVARFLDVGSRSVLVPVLLALVIAYVWFAAAHDEVERARVMQRDLTASQNELIERLLSPGEVPPPVRPLVESRAPIPGPGAQVAGSVITVPAIAQLPPSEARVRTARGFWFVALGLGGLGLAAAGLCWWWFAPGSTGAKALITIGAITASGSLIGEVNVDRLLSIEKVPLTISIPTNTPLFTGTGAQRLGTVTNFKLASEVLPTAKEVTEALSAVTMRWTENRAAGKTGILLLVGSADRVPLKGAALRRFESNVGLARARAEAVKAHLQQAFINAGHPVDERQILVLVSGPQSTPDSQANGGSEGTLTGYPNDRSVDVWAVWGWEQPVARSAER
jgi:hypothetical protein